jgi:hypothetical protein
MVLRWNLEVDWLNTLKKEGVTQLARLAATGLEVAASEPKILAIESKDLVTRSKIMRNSVTVSLPVFGLSLLYMTAIQA